MSVGLPQLESSVLLGAIEAAADRAGIGIFIVRLDVTPPRVVYVNDWTLRMSGSTREEIHLRPPWVGLAPADQERIREMTARSDGPPTAIEVTIEMADGGRRPVELGTSRIETADGLFSFGYLRDVSAERRAVEALRQSEERFRFLVERAPDGVVILVGGKIVFINPTATRLFGADPATVIGSSVLQYLPPPDAQLATQRIGEMFRTGKEISPNEYGVLADPSRTVEIKSILCEWEGARAVLAFARDVTERKAIQNTLIAADRFAALGKLAAGIAHEINNPLAYVELSLELIERRLAKLAILDDVPELRSNLREARHGLARIGAVTADLRTFARTDDTPPGAVDLIAIVDQSLRMVDNDLRHRARLIREMTGDPLAVIGNASRLEQVFVNILINAIQSLRDPTTDTITVAITSSEAADVVVSITDTGHGIPSTVCDRVFDPFFTTKPVGEGMGLGLSVCKNIVESIGGRIAIESTSAGTTVSVVLRAFTRTTQDAATPRKAALARERLARYRVLIVDDERLVRDTLAALLSTYHDVTVVEGGTAALDRLADHLAPAIPDVILCDVMMPDMNGMELHRRVALAHSGVERRIVFITGGAFVPELVGFLAATGNRCVPKPFRIDELLAAIAATAG